MGKLAATTSAGRLLGPALGGLLAGFLAFRQLFLLVGLMIATAAIFVTLYLREPPPSSTRSSASLIENFRKAAGEPRLRLALPGLLVAMLGISMTMPIFPLYVEDRWSADFDPKLLTGIGFATVAGFTLIASTLLGRIADRIGLKALLVGSLTLAAVSLLLHPLVASVGSMLALRALLGVSAAGIGPVLHAMISRATPEGMRGGITGLANSATIFGFFIGPIGGGLMANLVGIEGVFRIASACAFSCAVVAAVIARRTGRSREIPTIPREVPR